MEADAKNAGDRIEDFDNKVESNDEDEESETSLEKMLKALPKSVKRKIKALKKLQFETINIELKFYEEVHALECKFNNMYQPIFEKRSKIVKGEHNPTDSECDWPSDEEELDENVIKNNKINLEASKKEANELGVETTADEDPEGIPNFWLTILKNVSSLSEMVQEHDEPILKHLVDIKLQFKEKPMGFLLEFYFKPNDYFTNSILTKEYSMKCAPESDDPFSFEGPEIFKSKGCTIDWKDGKNVTLKTVKKRKKHKTRGVVKTVQKTVQNDSFFNFFSPPSMPTEESEIDDETFETLTNDFEVGHYIRERIVPRAVLYFTGEGLSDEEYEESSESESEDDDVDFDIS